MWVFGYGSLLWNPGFTPVETVPARLTGWQRSFCMLSLHYRGTPESPGLVLALDRAADAVCAGMAFRVAPADQADVLAALRERELISDAYLECQLPLELDDGRDVDALAYVINPANAQYCRIDLPAQAAIIARAHGGRGPNYEYLYRTAAQLDAMGVADAAMDELVTRVRHLRGEDSDNAR